MSEINNTSDNQKVILDSWEDLLSISKSQRTKLLQALSEVTITRNWVNDRITEALGKSENTVDEKIDEALKDITADQLGDVVSTTDLSTAVQALKEEIESKGYLVIDDLDPYAKIVDLSTLQENITEDFENADTSVLDYADAMFATKEEISDLVNNQEMKEYVAAQLGNYSDSSANNAQFSEISSSIDEINSHIEKIDASVDELAENSSKLSVNLKNATSLLSNVATQVVEQKSQISNLDASLEELKGEVKANEETALELINDLSEKSDNQDSSISAIKEEIAGLKSEHTQYDKDITDLQELTETLSDSIDQLSSDVVKTAIYESKMSEIDGKLSELSDNDSSVKDAIDSINLTLSALTGSDTETSGIISELKAADASLADAIETAKTELKSEIDLKASSEELSSVSENVTNLTSSLEDTDSSVSEIKSEIEEINGKISGLDVSVSALETSLETVNGNISEINSEIESVKADYALTSSVDEKVAGVSAEVSSVDGKVTALEEKVSDIDSSVANLYDKIVSVGGSVDSIDASLAEVEKKAEEALNEYKESVDSSLSEIAESIENIEENYVKNETYSEKVSEIEKNISDLQAADVTLNESVEKVDGRVDEIEKEIDAIKKSDEALSQELNDKAEAINKVIDDKVAELQAKDSEIESNVETEFNKVDSEIESLKNSDTELASAIENKAAQLKSEAEEKFNKVDSEIENLKAKDSQLEDADKALDKKIEELRASVYDQHTVDDAFGKVNATLANLEKEDERLLNGLKDLKDNSATKSDIESVKDSIAHIESDLSKAENNLTNMYQRVLDMYTAQDSRVDKISEKVVNLRNKVDNNKAAIDDLKSLVATKADAEKVAEIKDGFKELEADVKAKLEALDRRVDGLPTDENFENAYAEIHKIEDTVNKLSEEINSWKETVEGTLSENAGKLSELETSVKGVEDKFEEYSTSEEVTAEIAAALEDYQKKGDYVAYTEALADPERPERKCIMLKNHDQIAGLNAEGNDAANLVMLSKWNVADFGSVKYPFNINAKDGKATLNDVSVIATVDDLEESLKEYTSLEAFAELQKKVNDFVGESEGNVEDAIKEALKVYITAEDAESKIAEAVASIKGEGELDAELDTLVKIVAKINELVAEPKVSVEEFNTLSGKVTEIEGNLATVSESVSNLEDKTQSIDSDVEALEGRVETLEVSMGYVENKNTQLDERLKIAEKALEGKQESGDFVSYTTDEESRKHIILDNHVNIVGTTTDGMDGVNLVMMSKWDVADFGSVKCHMNLNSTDGLITINDKEKIATRQWAKNKFPLLADFTKLQTAVVDNNTEIKRLHDAIFGIGGDDNDGNGGMLDETKVRALLAEYIKTADAEEKIQKMYDDIIKKLYSDNGEEVDTDYDTFYEVGEAIKALQSGKANKDAFDNLVSEVAKKADADSLENYVTKTDAEEFAKSSDLDVYAKAEEVIALEQKVEEKASNEAVEALKSEVAEKQDKGDYVAYVPTPDYNENPELSRPERKAIVLANHDNIVATNAAGNDNANLVMLSKWDVADFGSSRYAFNINAKDGKATLNDTSVIATLDDVQAISQTVVNEVVETVVEGKIEDKIEEAFSGSSDSEGKSIFEEKIEEKLQDYAKSEEIEKELEKKADAEKVETIEETVNQAVKDITDVKEDVTLLTDSVSELEKKDFVLYSEAYVADQYKEKYPDRKCIALRNYDQIASVTTDGDGVNLVMLSQWDVADFGSSKVAFNINAKDGIATLNDTSVIATLDDIKSQVEESAKEIEKKVEESVKSVEDKLESVEEKLDGEGGVLETVESKITEVEGKISESEKKLEGEISDVDKKADAAQETADEAKSKIEELEKKDFVVYTDTADAKNPGRKSVFLANHDNIVGYTNPDFENAEGGAVNLVMLSKWNVADFGASSVHFNINSKDRPTVNDDIEIAYKSEVEAVSDAVDALEERLDDGFVTKEEFAEKVKEIIDEDLTGEEGVFTELEHKVEEFEDLLQTKAEKTVVEELTEKLVQAVDRIAELEKRIEEMDRITCIDKDVNPDEVENPEETDLVVKNDDYLESFKSGGETKTFKNITVAGGETTDELTFSANEKVELINLTILP